MLKIGIVLESDPRPTLATLLVNFVSKLFHLGVHVLFEQVVTHCHDTHAQEDVNKIDDEFQLVQSLGRIQLTAHVHAGHEVSEPDLEEGRDAEVDRVKIVPILPLGEQDGPDQQVDRHHP